MNAIIPGRLYQRGQILTWTREDKRELFERFKIRGVVNLWPKLDPDLTDIGLDWYLYVPVPRSEDMLESTVQMAAYSASTLLRQDPGAAALLLCEAGKTRSVCFAIMVLKYLHDTSYFDAYNQVVGVVPNHSLKPFMVEFFRAN